MMKKIILTILSGGLILSTGISTAKNHNDLQGNNIPKLTYKKVCDRNIAFNWNFGDSIQKYFMAVENSARQGFFEYVSNDSGTDKSGIFHTTNETAMNNAKFGENIDFFSSRYPFQIHMFNKASKDALNANYEAIENKLVVVYVKDDLNRFKVSGEIAQNDPNNTGRSNHLWRDLYNDGLTYPWDHYNGAPAPKSMMAAINDFYGYGQAWPFINGVAIVNQLTFFWDFSWDK